MPFHERPETPVLHVVPASQYSTKALAGLESRNIAHYVVFAAPVPSDRKLPSGGTAVPELEFQSKGVPDSSEILKLLDSEERRFRCVDPSNVDRLDALIESKLDPFVDYFNYVDEEGHRNSVRESLARFIPWYAKPFVSIDKRLKPKIDSVKAKCDVVFAELFDGSSASSKSEVLQNMHVLLNDLETELAENEFLIPSATQPTIADLALYSKVCRLTDENGDVQIGAALPDMLEGHERLQRWFLRMQVLCPLRWKGKRAPKKA